MKENFVEISWKLKIGLIVTILLVAGCRENDICDDYCDKAYECAALTSQMFSASECVRNCRDSRERNASIGCEVEGEDYIVCLIDLSCNNWHEQGQRCPNEVDRLNACIDDHT